MRIKFFGKDIVMEQSRPMENVLLCYCSSFGKKGAVGGRPYLEKTKIYQFSNSNSSRNHVSKKR